MHKNQLREMTPREFYENHKVIWGWLTLAFVVCDFIVIAIIYYLFK